MTMIAPQYGIGPTRPRLDQDYDRARDHALRRLWERHALRITKTEYARLCNDVRSRRGRVNGRTVLNPDAVAPDGVPVYRLVVRGSAVWAAWNPRLGIIGTFYVL